ncbi:hypothetical protein OUZ56_000597 [Daphnia magna]|uniref:Uncharacterized protein n=1 Tax=Daphnia magna TaxID=35525 RepID=A0ABR0A0Y7_9CRUS|nr:hypothetical protein OUZ56_000597 [Daphnia magna]
MFKVFDKSAIMINLNLEDNKFVSCYEFSETNGRHPSAEPFVIDDIHSGHDCVVNWYHFYKAKQNYVAFLLHWTAGLDHVSNCERDHSFFAFRCINRNDVHFLDVIAHKTLMHYSYLEVISTSKGKSEEGILFRDIKNGNFMD